MGTGKARVSATTRQIAAKKQVYSADHEGSYV